MRHVSCKMQDAHLAAVDSHRAQLPLSERRRKLGERRGLRRRAAHAHARHAHALQLRREAAEPSHQAVGEVVLAAARAAAPGRAHVDRALLPCLLRVHAVDADEAVLLRRAREALRLGHGELREALRVEVTIVDVADRPPALLLQLGDGRLLPY